MGAVFGVEEGAVEEVEAVEGGKVFGHEFQEMSGADGLSVGGTGDFSGEYVGVVEGGVDVFEGVPGMIKEGGIVHGVVGVISGDVVGDVDDMAVFSLERIEVGVFDDAVEGSAGVLHVEPEVLGNGALEFEDKTHNADIVDLAELCGVVIPAGRQ